MIFTDYQKKLLRKTICPTEYDADFHLFIEQCEQLDLNPFVKQVYAVSRYNKAMGRQITTMQISIEGTRILAERTGKYAGQIGPYFCGTDGKWNELWIDDKPPIACKIGIIRRDFKEPVWSIMKYSRAASKDRGGNPTIFWADNPEGMLAKSTEMNGLKRAFPQIDAQVSEVNSETQEEYYEETNISERHAREESIANLKPTIQEKSKPQPAPSKPKTDLNATLTEEKAGKFMNSVTSLAKCDGKTALGIASTSMGRQLNSFMELTGQEALDVYEDVKLFVKQGEVPKVEKPAQLDKSGASKLHKSLGAVLKGTGVKEEVICKAVLGKEVDSFTSLTSDEGRLLLSSAELIADGKATIDESGSYMPVIPDAKAVGLKDGYVQDFDPNRPTIKDL